MMIKLIWLMETVLQNATLVFGPGSYSESYYLAQRRLRTDPGQAVIIWSSSGQEKLSWSSGHHCDYQLVKRNYRSHWSSGHHCDQVVVAINCGQAVIKWSSSKEALLLSVIKWSSMWSLSGHLVKWLLLPSVMSLTSWSMISVLKVTVLEAGFIKWLRKGNSQWLIVMMWSLE